MVVLRTHLQYFKIIFRLFLSLAWQSQKLTYIIWKLAYNFFPWSQFHHGFYWFLIAQETQFAPSSCILKHLSKSLSVKHFLRWIVLLKRLKKIICSAFVFPIKKEANSWILFNKQIYFTITFFEEWIQLQRRHPH